jgi:hypothetical protein
MKANDKPQISKRWWTSEKPPGVKGVELEKALQQAEKALAEDKANGDKRSIDACVAALEEVRVAADKTVKKELDKQKHKDVIAVLEKYAALIKAEISRLEASKKQLADGQNGDGDDEEDVDENKLFEKDYVCKMMKLMKSAGKELKFGFGLNTNSPEASKLLLQRKGKPEQLFKILKQSGEFSNRVLTYGTAVADPEDGKTLVLRLADGANEPPQMIKLGRTFLRADKGLCFRKFKLVLPGGRAVQDNEPDTEDGKAAAASGDANSRVDLSRELANIQSLIAAWQQTLREVTAQIDKLRKALDVQSDPALRSVGDGLGELVSQFPDLDLSKLVDAAKSNNRSAYEQTLAQTGREIQEVQKMLADGPLLATIDENPFVKTSVHATVNVALQRIAKQLNLSA